MRIKNIEFPFTLEQLQQAPVHKAVKLFFEYYFDNKKSFSTDYNYSTGYLSLSGKMLYLIDETQSSGKREIIIGDPFGNFNVHIPATDAAYKLLDDVKVPLSEQYECDSMEKLESLVTGLTKPVSSKPPTTATGGIDWDVLAGLDPELLREPPPRPAAALAADIVADQRRQRQAAMVQGRVVVPRDAQVNVVVEHEVRVNNQINRFIVDEDALGRAPRNG